MKDIKSFLIGFLSCVCIMLFMGQTSSIVGQTSNNLWECSLGKTLTNWKGDILIIDKEVCEANDGIWTGQRVSSEEVKQDVYLEAELLTASIYDALSQINFSGNKSIQNVKGMQNGRYQISTSAWDNELFTIIFDTQNGKIMETNRTDMRNTLEAMDKVLKDMNIIKNINNSGY